MSLQDARNFLDEAKDSKDIQKEVSEGKKDYLSIARDHGYDFTHDEVNQAMYERKLQAPNGEDDPDTCCAIM